MATNKKFTMKKYNGTDFDIYYPKTIIGQVDNLQTELTAKEVSSNKVSSISSSSTDTQYPSAKCVYDIIGNVETLLSQI